MNFGGPVWHVSVASPVITLLTGEILRDMAFGVLEGFGDAGRGEWTEPRPRAFHLRRRLTAKEQEITGDAVDIRGTVEEKLRIVTLVSELPDRLKTFAWDSYKRGGLQHD